MALYSTDPSWGRSFTKVSGDLPLPTYGLGVNGVVHMDVVEVPGSDDLMAVYTPYTMPNEIIAAVRSPISDMFNWSGDEWANPIIPSDPGPDIWWRVAAADPCLLYLPSDPVAKWRLFYTGSPLVYPHAICLATSNDRINWTDQGQVMPAQSGGYSWESNVVRGSTVLYNADADRLEMFYDTVPRDYSVRGRLGRAESYDGGFTWINRAEIFNPVSYGYSADAMHPCVRYFDGMYWVWFPMQGYGLFLITSSTGAPGTWSAPVKVLDKTALRPDATQMYRTGLYIGRDYVLHAFVSYVYAVSGVSVWGIQHFKSDLSAAGKAQQPGYTLDQFTLNGTVKGNLNSFAFSAPPLDMSAACHGPSLWTVGWRPWPVAKWNDVLAKWQIFDEALGRFRIVKFKIYR